jgi:DNA-binding transcriptional MocR family regulator
MSEIQSREYFAIVPEWIVLADISSNAIRLYALLNRFANSQGRAWPSRKTLADLMRTSTATVDRAKDELVAIGALEIEHRLNAAGDPSSNLYILTTSSPMTRGTPKDEERGTPKDDALNRVNMKQSQISVSSKMKTCSLCLGKYKTGYEDIDEEGLSHIWQAETSDYIVCPKCQGVGTQ